MPKREVLKTIIIMRGKPEPVEGEKDGRGKPLMRAPERYELKVGEKFDFTNEELEQIMATDPTAVSDKTVVSLDDEDVDPRKLPDTSLASNQTSAPQVVDGQGDKKNEGGDEL